MDDSGIFNQAPLYGPQSPGQVAMRSQVKMNSEKREERSIFWSLLLIFVILAVIISIPSFLRPENNKYIYTVMFASSLGLNILATLGIRYLFIKRLYKFSLLIALATGIAILTAILEWVVFALILYAFSIEINWENLFTQFLFDGSDEVWFMLAWAVLYISFVQNSRVRHQAMALAKAKSLAHQAELSVLRYQLNPHFLFNTLNSLSALILKKHNEEAESVLIGLSRFLRYTLDSGSTQLVTLEEDIAAQRDYLAIEKTRFQERLQLNFDVPTQLSRALVPSLLMQPIVENAIKHVIAKNKDTSEISIKAHEDQNKLVITVEDNGPGVADPEAILDNTNKKVGLKNTAERLELLYGDAASLRLQNRAEGGLCVTIIMPLYYGNENDKNPAG